MRGAALVYHFNLLKAFVSDVAMFVLKRYVRLQLTNCLKLFADDWWLVEVFKSIFVT